MISDSLLAAYEWAVPLSWQRLDLSSGREMGDYAPGVVEVVRGSSVQVKEILPLPWKCGAEGGAGE